jgi:hypothetical protein
VQDPGDDVPLTTRGRVFPVRGALTVTLLLAPAAASAHAAERMVILTLPTGWYMLGAALAVVLTALVTALAPRAPRLDQARLFERQRLLSRTLTSMLSCVVLFALIAIGFLGSRDPFANLLPLTIWTIIWVGLPILAAIFGDVWRPIEPWTGPVRLARRATGRTGSIGLSRLGHLPAVAGLFAFAWFEIVSLAPADPLVLARVVLAYWLLHFLIAVLEGETWLAHGETFTVYFGLIARIAPLWTETDGARVRHMAAPPGHRLVAGPPMTPGLIAFVTLALAAVTFDGVSETFRWLALIGINPLEFPGRSAVTGINTVGLLGAWTVMAASILAAIWAGWRLAGSRGSFGRSAGRLVPTFLPIAAGFHAAHYLISLLTGGQYALAALNDPLHTGARLLGLPHDWITFGFLADRHQVLMIWNAQFALVLGAHVLALVLSIRAAPDWPWKAHLPMTGLMVALTTLGLWLLSSPTGA